MDPKVFNNEAYFAERFQTFEKLRKRQKTCDISILTANNNIKAHKIVLASASEYFKNAIYGLFSNECSKNELDLTDVKYEIMSSIVDYMYTGRIEINSESVYDIYKAADYCMMNFVKILCLEFLLEDLNDENCLKIWIMANDCKYEKLRIAATNTIFANLEIASNTSEFLNLSKEEILDLLGLWSEDKSCDSIISVALKWSADKEHWDDTLINFFKEISFTRISDDYLENVLTHNELIQNSFSCKKWMININKEKSKLFKLQQAESEAELKFARFLVDQPIIFMKTRVAACHNFYKFNCRDGALNIFSTIKPIDYCAFDCITYKKWIYVVGDYYCKRFSFDNPNNGYESVFDHNHGSRMKVAVLNESMYIFGGAAMGKKCSSIDLTTKECTSFSLLYERVAAGVAVNDGSIFICGGTATNIVEHFDPREGRNTKFGTMPFGKNYTFAAALPNQIYCSQYDSYKMMDLRNNRICIDIKSPGGGPWGQCLFSSYGRLFTVFYDTIFMYNNTTESWDTLRSLPQSNLIWYPTSFE